MRVVQKTFTVELHRIEVRRLEVQVAAESAEEAERKALDFAGDQDFTQASSPQSVQYEATALVKVSQ